MSDDITVMDLNATEDASMMMADVFDELQKQMAIIQFAMSDLDETGRGAWLETVRADVEDVQVKLVEAAARIADISDFLFDMVSVFRGNSETVDGDDFEDFE